MLLELGAALALGVVALGALIGKNPSTRSMDVARP
jgi:hypothetical protein